jgi:hypothetical protein
MRVRTQCLKLDRQVLYHLTHICSPFLALVIFWMVSCIFCLWPASEHNPPIYASHLVGTTDMYHHAQFVDWDGVLLTFWPSWPQTTSLLIFTESNWDYKCESLYRRVFFFFFLIFKKSWRTSQVRNRKSGAMVF